MRCDSSVTVCDSLGGFWRDLAGKLRSVETPSKAAWRAGIWLVKLAGETGLEPATLGFGATERKCPFAGRTLRIRAVCDNVCDSRALAAASVAGCALAFPVAATADGYRMPTLTATNPAPATVDLDWTGLYGPRVILWQCHQPHGCFDTLRPNTGHVEIQPAPIGWDSYRVCVPAYPQDPTVSLDVH